jgi:hypothetical protein
MDKIAMNEFNKVRFIKEWAAIKDFIMENNLPHFQDGQSMIIITELPTKLYTLMKGFNFTESFWNEKVMFRIRNEQFKADKPDSVMFNKIHEYLCLEVG